MTEKIFGGKINKIVKQRCQPHQEYFQGKLLTIIMFKPPKNEKNQQLLSQYEAAVISTNEKVKTFEFLGCKVDRLELAARTEAKDFGQIIDKAANNVDSIGIIVQNPLPSRYLKGKLYRIPKELDIDGLIPNHPIFKASATSEAVARLVESFAGSEDKVAVVGSRGFVGQGVVKLLKEKEIKIIELDRANGDNLKDIQEKVLEAEIVVSATGQANLLGKEFLKPEHKLVIDTGFIPQLEGKLPLGDIEKDAYEIPQRITPVPGGVGPAQMAVLLERIMRMAQIKIESWDYKKDILLESQQEKSSQEKKETVPLELLYERYSEGVKGLGLRGSQEIAFNAFADGIEKAEVVEMMKKHDSSYRKLIARSDEKTAERTVVAQAEVKLIQSQMPNSEQRFQERKNSQSRGRGRSL